MKKNKLILGLDMDGVIIDSTRNKIKFAAELGFKLKPVETPADYFDKIIPSPIAKSLRELLYLNPTTALTADVVPGAIDGLAALKSEGVEYYLISRRKIPSIAKELLKQRGLWPKYFNDTNAFLS